MTAPPALLLAMTFLVVCTVTWLVARVGGQIVEEFTDARSKFIPAFITLLHTLVNMLFLVMR